MMEFVIVLELLQEVEVIEKKTEGGARRFWELERKRSIQRITYWSGSNNMHREGKTKKEIWVGEACVANSEV